MMSNLNAYRSYVWVSVRGGGGKGRGNIMRVYVCVCVGGVGWVFVLLCKENRPLDP